MRNRRAITVGIIPGRGNGFFVDVFENMRLAEERVYYVGRETQIFPPLIHEVLHDNR